MIFDALATVAILVLMGLMSALTNYIEDILGENAEQQVASFTEQAAYTSAGRLELVQDAFMAFEIQDDSLEAVQPLLANYRQSFGFCGVWFVRNDGRGISWNGEPFSVSEFPAGVLDTLTHCSGPGIDYDFSQNFVNEQGQSVRIAHKVLFVDGQAAGDFYQEVPIDLFTMPDELDMFDGRGYFMLIEGATGEVLALPSEPMETPLGVDESIYAYLEGMEAPSSASAPGTSAEDAVSRPSRSGSVDGVVQLRELVKAGRTGAMRAVVDDAPSYIAMAPIAGSTWYACSVIPEENLRSQTGVVATTFQGVFAIVLLCLVGMCGALLVAYQRRIRARNVATTGQLYQALSESVDMAVSLYSPQSGETTHIVAKSDGVVGYSFDQFMADAGLAKSLQMSVVGTNLFDRIRTGEVNCLERGSFSLVKPHESATSWVEYAVRPLDFEGHRQLLIVLQDVTTEKTIQLSMKDAMDAAESANRAKSEFLSRMSHDIRTPMNVVVGMLQIAEANIDNAQKVRTCLSKIATASNQLLGLINEVLDFSKIESGKMVLDRLPFNLNDLMKGAADVARMQAEERNQQLVLSVDDGGRPVLIGDEVRLNQMLMNLLSNAVKYTPEGGAISLSATVGREKSGYCLVTFTVCDNGIGMSEEFQKHLFEPFSMEGRSREQGTGLGMSIVKNIVSLMGGMITVRSTEGEGTMFTVIVSLAIPEDEKAASEDPLDGVSLDNLDEVVLSAREGRGTQVTREAPEAPGAGRSEGAVDGEAVGTGRPEGDDATGGDVQPSPTAVAAPVDEPVATVGRRPAADESVVTPDCGAGLRVLLAEDNDLNAEIAEELLCSYGFALERAIDGEEACAMFASSAPNYYDVVLMDVQMPRKDGYQATRAIRAMDRPDAASVPIIAMSANAFSDDIAASLASGMNEHLSKPIQIKRVVATILLFVRKDEGGSEE